MFEHMFYRATDSAKFVDFDHMYWPSPFFFNSMMVFMWITWILVIIALVLGIIWLWKQINNNKK
jgi:uncharacterized membrane protein